MSEKALVLIDGNNLYHNLNNMKLQPSDLDFLKFSDLICTKFGVNRNHIIYYNSIPKMTDPAYFDHKDFLESLENQNIEVKKRVLQYHSNMENQINMLKLIEKMNLCDKCKPTVLTNLLKWVGNVIKKEKGIDVMIAVETIKSVIEKKYDCCIVVSGDSDLLSAMEFAESMGGKIFSASVYTGYSSQIRQKFKGKYFAIERTNILNDCIKMT
jgi:uncharacterized LabA/DUF88 family protein